jgi:hypothetical protein
VVIYGRFPACRLVLGPHAERAFRGHPASSPFIIAARPSCPRVIPEIDIWRAAQLMLKRYGDKALDESTARAEELAGAGDGNGAATWRRITHAVAQFANVTPPGPVH